MTTQHLTLRGVPATLANDAWWLSAEADTPTPPPPPSYSRRANGTRLPHTIPAFLGLMVLADWLFYGHWVGLSLTLFAWATFAVAAFPHGRRAFGPAILLGLASLPALEYLQTLSLLFLLGGLTTSLVWLRSGTGALGRGALRLWCSLPIGGLRAAVANARSLPTPSSLRPVLRNWALPAGGALILMALLIDANPVLSDHLNDITLPSLDLSRPFFWGGTALVLWSLLFGPTTPKPTTRSRRALSPETLGINAASVARSLLVFNALMLVQTAMDVTYLWGGADLPDGMTYAQYAHRGAYPLMLTAMLAGAFALAARPFLAEHPGLKPLMMLWLAQNIALVLSSLYRLDLYIDAYGLTYLRVHAAIWMLLVATGLGLTAWQIHTGKPAAWLLKRCAGLGLGTLYLCCFINFAHLIASFNVDQAQAGGRFDERYHLNDLPPTAATALKGIALETYSNGPIYKRPPSIRNWRDWDFRKARVIRSFNATTPAEVTPDENSRH